MVVAHCGEQFAESLVLNAHIAGDFGKDALCIAGQATAVVGR